MLLVECFDNQIGLRNLRKNNYYTIILSFETNIALYGLSEVE